MPEPPPLSDLRSTIHAYYEQWRELTETETEAIALEDWALVDRSQQSKRELQILIGNVRAELRGYCRQKGIANKSMEQELYPLIEELLAMEGATRRRSRANAPACSPNASDRIRQRNN